MSPEVASAKEWWHQPSGVVARKLALCVIALALVASLVPFFLVSNLLLLNQFPDVAADRSVGRDNFPIAVGTEKSAAIFAAFGFLAYLTLLVLAEPATAQKAPATGNRDIGS